MKDSIQRHQALPPSAAAQRESRERGGALSAQLASSPRLLEQRRLIGQTLGSAVQRVEGELDEEDGRAAQLRSEPVQRLEGGLDEEEEPPATAQLRAEPAQRQENRTGMPDGLKAGIESLSGMDMSEVRVHRNSSQPAQLNALAYAQGNDIHLGPGQEQHLPHEAWHVVQQRQGRVQATMQMAGVGVNDDVGLEREADVMGGRAVQMLGGKRQDLTTPHLREGTLPIQRMPAAEATLEQRLNLGKELAINISKDKFNDMVGRVLKHGHAYDNPGQGKSYFIRDEIGSLLEFVTQALESPNIVSANGTRLVYKKDLGFTIGKEQSDGTERTAVAVVIDLARVQSLSDVATAIETIGLVVAYPCRV
jgi:hypothetical protein